MDDIITEDELVEELGNHDANRLLAYRAHYNNAGQRFWTRDRAEELLGVMRIEDEREEAREP